MKMSHVALLSVLFVAPAFASQAPATQPGTISQIINTFIVTPFDFVESKTLDAANTIANYTVSPVFNKIASFLPAQVQSFFATNNDINRAGRTAILLAAAYAAYQAYLALNAQNSSDDEVIFADEYADIN
jgi:hypothetical protein